jgi:hypothetical protein
MLYIGYIILGLVAIVMFLLSYLLAKLLLPKEEDNQILTKISFSLATTFSLTLLLMICVDDFDINTMPVEKSESKEIEIRHQVVKWSYYGLFIMMLILMWAVSPFAYFLYEEGYVI